MNHDVFISYSSKNRSTANAICHALEQQGILCWVAPRDIEVGQRYGEVIEQAIKECKIFVIVFSEHSAISPWVESELNIAFCERKIIMPFRIDEADLSGEMRLILNNRHWIEAYPNPEDYFSELIAAASRLLDVKKTDNPNQNNNREESKQPEPSNEEDVNRYRKAAEQGHARAQFNLGCSYANGQGVPQDYKEAAKWYRKAAEQGDADAQFNLGCFYANGQGVTQDYTQAAKWFGKAAEQGNMDAKKALDRLNQ